MTFPSASASGCSAKLLDGSAGSEEKQEESLLPRHLLMLVRHDIGQLRQHVVPHHERMQKRLSSPCGHPRRNERRHRVLLQLAAEDIVVRDPLGKSDEVAHFPLQSQREFAHPCLFGRSDGIGVETLPEHLVALELLPELRQIALSQYAPVQSNSLCADDPIEGCSTKQPQEVYESIKAVWVHPHINKTPTQPHFFPLHTLDAVAAPSLDRVTRISWVRLRNPEVRGFKSRLRN
jgi:hypothetical protein